MRHLRSLEYGAVWLGSQDIVHAFTVQISSSSWFMRVLVPHKTCKWGFPLTTCLHSLLKPLSRFHFSVARILQKPVPKCPTCYTLPPLSIPPWDGMDRLGLYQSVPVVTPYPHCPSRPTAPWEGIDRLGSYQSVQFNCYTLFSLSIHCTMEGMDR